MAPQLISAIAHKYAGKPILVIGGGPSVTADLLRIPQNYPACVISANGHGYKQDRFKVDYIVNVDFTMGGTRNTMQEVLGAYPAPKINKWHWADYRLPNTWHYGGDSGMTAIVVAAALGGHPVFFTGMDRMVGNRKYFWQETPDAAFIARQKRPNLANVDNVNQAIGKIAELTKGAAIRAMSGPLTRSVPRWKLDEALPEYAPCFAMRHCFATGKLYRVVASHIFLYPADKIPAGTLMMLTDREAGPLIRDGKVRLA